MTTVMVYANKEYNLVETGLSPGDQIRFVVESGQTWKDSCIECDENGHGHDNLVWEAVSHTCARMRDSPFFALTAAICEWGRDPTDHCLVRVGSDLTYVVGGDPAKKYDVYLFANDVQWFYWNNSGAICVIIKVTRRS